ncbi:WG repeat-containing protein [Fulvivirga sediminis]|uniref:WG repeat-containing protein n=1 Tax=Fulvivirga sediminis TaxID=2803949 RepID=A0A937FBK8_9BACT|nr:WG repeat-containing protein [Fulvivirga sediminis]MBL3657568.1 WG repeat-containing protein [Fulvivirga sediminis]
MKIRQIAVLIFSVSVGFSCENNKDKETTSYQYFDRLTSDTVSAEKLIAVTDEEYLQFGANVAFVNQSNDTIISFGKYAYYGTDTLEFYANVIEHTTDSTYGRQMAIDRNQNVLFDIVMFDNGPEPFNEGLTRVLRNGKMGYANKFGQVVIPCEYDFAKWFENGKAEVTYRAEEHIDPDGHKRVESDEWFFINKKGQKL